MNEKPWVKTYCGGKPNYCTTEVTGEVTRDVDAVNISQERVDETAKREHEPWCDSVTKLLLSFPPQIPPCNCKPKREWVGLTDSDKQEAFDETQEASGGFWEFADYLEAKLKEKNGG